MRTLHWLEASQRSILVLVPTWIVWCAVITFSAPYRPDGFAFMLFLFSSALCFLGCCWITAPLMPQRFGFFARLASQTICAMVPFTLSVLVGHFIVTTTRHWLS